MTNDAAIATSDNRQIILILPEMFSGDFKPHFLAERVVGKADKVHCLIRADKRRELLFAAALHRAGVNLEILQTCDAKAPPDYLADQAVRMLPGATSGEADDLAFALTDALLIPDDAEKGRAYDRWVKLAKDYKKDEVTRIGAKRAIMRADANSVLLALDPEGGASRDWLEKWVFVWPFQRKGRVEQAMSGWFRKLGAIHVAWPRGTKNQTKKKSKTPPWQVMLDGIPECYPPKPPRVGRGSGGMFSAYFTWGEWWKMVPDEKVQSEKSLVRWFNALDRSALFGASYHRDAIWFAHFFAALAVFLAVAGTMAHMASPGHEGPSAAHAAAPAPAPAHPPATAGPVPKHEPAAAGPAKPASPAVTGAPAPVHQPVVAAHAAAKPAPEAKPVPAEHGGGYAWLWSVSEFLVLLLGVMLPVGLMVRLRLQQRWMACRLGAEQLRIAYLCLPLMMLPRSFHSIDQDPHDKTLQTDVGRRAEAIAIAKRAIRDHGLPRRPLNSNINQAIDWVKLIVADQLAYHKRNHVKLEHSRDGLERFSVTVFVVVLGAVLLHLFVPWTWLILVTAGGPALAAGLYGIGTRLDLVHRCELSHDAYLALEQVYKHLHEIEPEGDEVKAWTDLRQWAQRASDALSAETENWHRLVLMQTVGLP